MRIRVQPLSLEMQNRNSLRDETLKLLAEVNYLLTEGGKLTEAEKIKESIIVIGPSNSENTSVIKALADSEQFNSQYKSDICLPQKFKINDTVFWACSNKIKSSMIKQKAILQVLVNIFFIKNLMEISEQLGFIIVTKAKATINKTIENFTTNIEDFISIFPIGEHTKLQENVICVLTRFDKNIQDKFIESLKNKKEVLKYFPDLFANLGYLYNSETQNDDIALSLKLENVSKILREATTIKINKLTSFLGTEQDTLKQNLQLINDLYEPVQFNVSNIYDIIKLIFEDKFDIYEARNRSVLFEIHYMKYVEQFSPKAKLIHWGLEKSSSCFPGLQQLLEFKEVLDKQNNDPLSAGLKILGIIKKFADNALFQAYYYILDQQIKELLLFEEALSPKESYKRYEATIKTCKSFLEKHYLISIKNIQPKDNQSIKYYREAIEWLKRYDKPEDIAKTKSICYSKIGDIYSNAENHQKALGNYNFALKYDENSKKLYDKMAAKLVELKKEALAIEYYKINNLFSEILECFKTLVNNSRSSEEKVNLYLKKGDYLLSRELFEEAAYAYSLAQSLESRPYEKNDILLRWFGAANKIPSSKLEFGFIPFDIRQEEITKIIGEYPEI